MNDRSVRLMLRYENGNPFSFGNLRPNASNASLFFLAQAFASVQSEQPERISTITTSRIMG